MKIVPNRIRLFLSAIVFIATTQIVAPSHAATQLKDAELTGKSKQEINWFSKLTKPFKEIRELRRKKREGTASPEELKKLDALIQNRRLLIGIIGMPIAFGLVMGGVFYWLMKKQSEEFANNTAQVFRLWKYQQQKLGTIPTMSTEERNDLLNSDDDSDAVFR